MADDQNNASVPSSTLPLPSTSTTSDTIPTVPTTASFFQPSSSGPSIPTQSQTSPSPLDRPQSNPRPPILSKPFGLPITAIAGAAAGVVLILLAVGIWWCLRRRRQRRRVSKSDAPFDSPKGSPDLENGDNNHNNDRKQDDARVSIDSFPGASPVQRPRDLENRLPSNDNNSRPSFSAARSPAPYIPPRSISFPMPETTSYVAPERSHEQQTNHIQIDMTDLDALMPIVVSNEIKPVPLLSAQQHTNVAQDNASKATLICTQPATAAAASTGITEAESRASTDTIMPTPILRRPKLTVRQSSDSYIHGGRARISMGLPPPPPPPTIPPPAIPISRPGDSGYGQGRASTESPSCRSSIYATHPAGRRTRASTEIPRIAYSRRSVSMDASSAGDGRRLSRRVIHPPSTPPPPTSLPPPPPIPVATPSLTTSVPPTPTPTSALVQQPQQQHVVPPPRQRHQRNPSQILNTSLFDSSDRSAISPPLSPLTIQIPRPSSRSFQSLLTINTQLTAENVQQYLQQQQPAPMEIAKPDSPTDSVAPSMSPKTTPFYQQSPRSRRKSTSQLETHKIMIPPSAASVASPTSPAFSPPAPPLPPVPTMPTLLADHLPSSPFPSSFTQSSNRSNTPLKRPSLSHQQSCSSLNSTHTDNSAAASVNARIDIHHYHHHYHDNNDGGADDGQNLYQYHHYHDGRHSAEPKKRQQQKQQHRRSMSLPSSPSSPSSQVELPGNDDSAPTASAAASRAAAVAAAASSKDQELQAIIADAIAIAAAKTAAVELARQSAFHRQMQAKYQQHQHHQQQQRRLFSSQQQHPQMDSWRPTTPSPSTLDSSRPGSPL